MEFSTAVQELLEKELTNPNIDKGWYSTIGASIFDACYHALEDSCHPDAHKGLAGTPYSISKQARMHVVSAPVGAGKTSFSLAFIAAMVRISERNPDAPYGCLFVADQKPRADQIYRDLNALIPGRVAIWTSDHDAGSGRKEPIKVLNPAARFTKEQLEDKPVAIVTHAFFNGKGSYKARSVNNQGRMQPRALTVIDERIEGVTVYDVDLAAAAAVRKQVKEDEDLADVMGPPMDALVAFMSDREFVGKGSLEKPSAEIEAWTNAEQNLHWFTSVQATNYVKAHSNDDALRAVFGFGKALALGRGFINRQQGTHFVGYESNLMIAPGTVLLDATSDIDGISELCRWRLHQEVPRARYDRLQIVHVPPHTTKNLTTYLKVAKNRRTYVNDWLLPTIMAHMAPGQKGLVVVKKSLIDNENVPIWPTGDERYGKRELYTEQWGWDIDGRQLSVIHWGTGVGDNAWQEADVVLLCDDFYLPRRTVIASVQGLRNHKATEGALGSMNAHNSKQPDVDLLQDGHILSWTKQMALRGKGRQYDENGVCGHQKLVCSGSPKKFSTYAQLLFPGAHVEFITRTDAKPTQAEALFSLLSRPNLPKKLNQDWLGQQLCQPWREISKNIFRDKTIHKKLLAIGWEYIRGKGKRGSYLQRIETTALPQTLAA
jgi:hypothetical protein